MPEAKFKVNVKLGEIEVEGSEEFVKGILDNIDAVLNKATSILQIKTISTDDSVNSDIRNGIIDEKQPEMNKSNEENESYAYKFAKYLGISVDKVIGALSVQEDEPYLHLDKHTWAAFKKDIPIRGPKSLSDVAIGATLITLFKEAMHLGKGTQKEATNLLKSIDVEYNNPSRGITKCEWLQEKNNELNINPVKIHMARQLVIGYCEGNGAIIYDY